MARNRCGKYQDARASNGSHNNPEPTYGKKNQKNNAKKKRPKQRKDKQNEPSLTWSIYINASLHTFSISNTIRLPLVHFVNLFDFYLLKFVQNSVYIIIIKKNSLNSLSSIIIIITTVVLVTFGQELRKNNKIDVLSEEPCPLRREEGARPVGPNILWRCAILWEMWMTRRWASPRRLEGSIWASPLPAVWFSLCFCPVAESYENERGRDREFWSFAQPSSTVFQSSTYYHPTRLFADKCRRISQWEIGNWHSSYHRRVRESESDSTSLDDGEFETIYHDDYYEKKNH